MQMSFVTGPNVDPRARTSVAGALERLGQYPAYFKQADHATLRQLSGKSRGSKECVVADAVAIEPVSVLQFSANREKNREFFVFLGNFALDGSLSQ